MADVDRPSSANVFLRELLFFVCAVLVGTISGIVSQQFLVTIADRQVAAHASLAVATTCTGAAHARLVHRKPIRELVGGIAAGAPIAYAAMRAIHFLVGL